MTITEFIDYVRAMHNASGDDYWSDLEIRKLLQAKCNEAVAIIGLIESKDTSITSTASTESYAYPSNVIFIKRVLFDNRPLKRISFRNWETRKSFSVPLIGIPQEYLLWDNLIYLYPSPSESSKTIELWVEKQHSNIDSSSTAIEVPNVLHTHLANAAVAMMFAKSGDPQMAAFYMDLWTRLGLPAMREFVRRRRRTGSYAVVTDSDSHLETDFGVI